MKQRGEPFSVIYEDNHLLVVNKRSGILVQGDATGDRPLVELCKDYIAQKYRKPGAVFLGLVHRIDRPVSGIVVLARTSKALERMSKLFREKLTKKTYWAIVGKRPSQVAGTLVHWLSKDPAKNRTTAYSSARDGALESTLNWRLISERANRYLLEVNPLTGRPHQIRVQLAAMGCPIEGDVKYGYPEPNFDGSISLHAKMLEFEHPVKRDPLVLEALPPANALWGIFSKSD